MKKIIGAILMIAGLAVGFFVIPSFTADTPQEILDKLQNGDEQAVTEKITTIAEESVLEYDYTNAVSMSDKEKLFKKISVPFGSKNIVMTYDGKMKIGADVSEINAEVGKDAEGNVETVAITLPDVEITSNEIDRDSIDFPVEKGTIINKLKNSDYDELETKAEAEIEKSVKESNVMKEAQAELQATLKGYIQGLYGEDVEVSFK